MRRRSANGGGGPVLLPMDCSDDFGGVGVEEDVDEDMLAMYSGAGQKKRRLSGAQVRALERSFEKDTKLDPEQKERMARDLGLQPRQVSIWFQNRRARWKTKQLERDYAALRQSFDALRADHDALRRDKDGLLAQIKELKAKLGEDDVPATLSTLKENHAASGVETKAVAAQGSSEERLQRGAERRGADARQAGHGGGDGAGGARACAPSPWRGVLPRASAAEGAGGRGRFPRGRRRGVRGLLRRRAAAVAAVVDRAHGAVAVVAL